MDVKDIKKLLDSMVEAKVSELTLETGDYKLSVRRGGEAVPVTTVETASVQAAPLPATQAQTPPPEASSATASAPAEERAASHLKDVTAPIVGTFYAASAPDAPPYVKVGDRVEKGSVLCIIEAMKLMNEIEAEVAGSVAEILVNNEEPVEYGQVLFRIDPS